MYGEGLSLEGDLLDLGVVNKLVAKSGAWYSYGGDRIGQGRENAKQFLGDHPDLRDRLELELRQALGLHIPAEAEAQPGPEAVEETPQAEPERGSQRAAEA